MRSQALAHAEGRKRATSQRPSLSSTDLLVELLRIAHVCSVYARISELSGPSHVLFFLSLISRLGLLTVERGAVSDASQPCRCVREGPCFRNCDAERLCVYV